MFLPTPEAAEKRFFTPPSTTVENTKNRYTKGIYTKVTKQYVGGDERSVPESDANIAWAFGGRNASGGCSAEGTRKTNIGESNTSEKEAYKND